MKNYLLLLGCLLSSLDILAQVPAHQSHSRAFENLLELMPGQYQTDVVHDPQVTDMNIRVARVRAEALGEHTFYVKYVQKGKLYRQRILVLCENDGKITTEGYSFVKDSLFVDFDRWPTDRQQALQKAEVKSSLGCASTWLAVDDALVGGADKCPFFSTRRGKNIYISDRMKFSVQGMATTEAGFDENGQVLFGKIDTWALELKRQK
jgi:CpeT/CpcT family (DUF1001)